jgi:AmiR/NasT family two-component response regulator
MTQDKPLLLLVDDDRLALHVTGAELGEAGYSIIAVESAEEAENVLASGERPDLAVIDINLPGKNGIDFAWRLKTLDQIPFIFISAFSDQEFVDRASEYGALSYIVKPVDSIKLVPIVTAALARAREMERLRSAERSLQATLDKDRNISIAIGIAMVQHQVDRKEAYELLRGAARSRRIKLIDLANEMISQAGAPHRVPPAA